MTKKATKKKAPKKPVDLAKRVQELEGSNTQLVHALAQQQERAERLHETNQRLQVALTATKSELLRAEGAADAMRALVAPFMPQAPAQAPQVAEAEG